MYVLYVQPSIITYLKIKCNYTIKKTYDQFCSLFIYKLSMSNIGVIAMIY